MPKYGTKFSQLWLDQVDGNGHSLRCWAKGDPKNVYAGYCQLCFKSIHCGNRGLQQMLSHATGEKHKVIACARFAAEVKHLVPVGVEGTRATGVQRTSATDKASTSCSVSLVPKSHMDQVLRYLYS